MRSWLPVMTTLTEISEIPHVNVAGVERGRLDGEISLHPLPADRHPNAPQRQTHTEPRAQNVDLQAAHQRADLRVWMDLTDGA